MAAARVTKGSQAAHGGRTHNLESRLSGESLFMVAIAWLTQLSRTSLTLRPRH